MFGSVGFILPKALSLHAALPMLLELNQLLIIGFSKKGQFLGDVLKCIYLMYTLKQAGGSETFKGRMRGVQGGGIGAGWALGGAGGKVTCPLLSLNGIQGSATGQLCPQPCRYPINRCSFLLEPACCCFKPDLDAGVPKEGGECAGTGPQCCPG